MTSDNHSDKVETGNTGIKNNNREVVLPAAALQSFQDAAERKISTVQVSLIQSPGFIVPESEIII